MRFAQESPSFRTGALTLVRLKRFMKTIKYIIPILIEHVNEISTFDRAIQLSQIPLVGGVCNPDFTCLFSDFLGFGLF